MDGRPAIERILLALGIALVMLAPILEIPLALAFSILLLVIVLNFVHGTSGGGHGPPRSRAR